MPDLATTDSPTQSFCTFRADGRLYGIDLLSLREISTSMAITPVPPAASAVRGLANLRSRILLVLDLRPLLGLPPLPCTEESRLLIFKPAVVQDAGLLVDGGGDIIAVPRDRIEAIEDNVPESKRTNPNQPLSLVVGVCKLEQELMMIIDAARLSGAVARLLT
ncbi:MAG TPA: chemotaxis protein CheW [Humisphaera sp.]|jgi:purine-binding chemotaxis protein CheW|nr:chemotaxis protein CheW [Humisphaera sp.]